MKDNNFLSRFFIFNHILFYFDVKIYGNTIFRNMYSYGMHYIDTLKQNILLKCFTYR